MDITYAKWSIRDSIKVIEAQEREQELIARDCKKKDHIYKDAINKWNIYSDAIKALEKLYSLLRLSDEKDAEVIMKAAYVMQDCELVQSHIAQAIVYVDYTKEDIQALEELYLGNG